jgi:23S rRNA pseudouridine2457 synthase
MCQFSPVEGKQTLADYFKVPKDVYPVGRLDYDSEGLLILTNDKTLNNKLLNPAFKHEREYWVEVEGAITATALQQLQKGITISIDGKQHHTLPAKAFSFETAPEVPERNPPVRFRKHIPTSWISLSLVEGKNRQVRKMTAAVGFPTLRLIRQRIEKITLEQMLPGDIKALNRDQISLLFS